MVRPSAGAANSEWLGPGAVDRGDTVPLPALKICGWSARADRGRVGRSVLQISVVLEIVPGTPSFVRISRWGVSGFTVA